MTREENCVKNVPFIDAATKFGSEFVTNPQPAIEDGHDAELLSIFRELWKDADDFWEFHRNNTAFNGYVSSDYEAAFHLLKTFQDRATTFLEWGSGLGVVAIMADLMGFDSYGIEAESILFDKSLVFADEFESEAHLVEGSFVPDGFDWDPSTGDEVYVTQIDLPDAYGELGMSLDDFDLVYAYPWPTEHSTFQNIFTQFGSTGATLLTYDYREGHQAFLKS